MGQPVVHFEVIGKDGPGLQRYYAELFDWEIDTSNPLKYGIVSGAGIAGGVASTGDGTSHVTFYVEVADVEAALAKAERLGGKRLFGPAAVPGTDVVLGQFTDPEGHMIGLTQSAA
jgi:predicted enzyme related to lactoylglutathione lyase